MMYEADFNYFLRPRHNCLSATKKVMRKRAFKNNINLAVIDLNQEYHGNGVTQIVKKSEKKVKKIKEAQLNKKSKVLREIWHKYCMETSIHGIKYCAQKNHSYCEKLIWIVLLFAAVFGITSVGYFLQRRFYNTPLATVVESTTYPVANIPYPAVTICNFNRLNWNRTEQVVNRYLKNASTTTRDQFRSYLRTLNHVEYGSFDEFIGIESWNIDEMLHIDLLEVFKETMYTCDELFDGAVCWWRNRYFNCCEIFDLQVSEYGLCYAFNSVVNPVGFQKLQNFTNYPWRTAQFADWSGLRVQMRAPQSSEGGGNGLMVAVTNPWEWPSAQGYIVPGGSKTGIMVRPTYSYATDNVLSLTLSQRKCIFSGESIINDEPVMKLPLPSDIYLSGNCYTECRQRHMIQYCNCTIAFFFATGNYTLCNMAGVRCLNKFDEILNYMKPPKGNPYFNDDDEGMTCECWQECTRLEYSIELSPNLVGDTASEEITLDVHFQRNTIVIYRTDLLYEWMDLLVGFGGIFGLFLGGSIMSGVEVLFYIFAGIVALCASNKN